jgi:hypothetical protein
MKGGGWGVFAVSFLFSNLLVDGVTPPARTQQHDDKQLNSSHKVQTNKPTINAK